MTKGRKVKHLSHYHGPAKITKQVDRHIYDFEFDGKTYGVLIRHCDNRSFDHEAMNAKLSPRKHSPSISPREGEYAIMKDGPTKPWSVGQVHQTLLGRIVVHWLTTI